VSIIYSIHLYNEVSYMRLLSELLLDGLSILSMAKTVFKKWSATEEVIRPYYPTKPRINSLGEVTIAT
jgi:hypothetical protein